MQEMGPAISPAAVKQIGKVKTVVLDPGHGGHDRGGKSAYGYEKDYTLDVVNRTRRILESKKVKVVQVGAFRLFLCQTVRK